MGDTTRCAVCARPCKRADGYCGRCAYELGRPTLLLGTGSGRPARLYTVGSRTAPLAAWATMLGVTRGGLWKAATTPWRAPWRAPRYRLDGRTGTLREWAAWIRDGAVAGARAVGT